MTTLTFTVGLLGATAMETAKMALAPMRALLSVRSSSIIV
jgi:hypothetical protein